MSTKIVRAGKLSLTPSDVARKWPFLCMDFDVALEVLKALEAL
jgi:hypothetical protein